MPIKSARQKKRLTCTLGVQKAQHKTTWCKEKNTTYQSANYLMIQINNETQRIRLLPTIPSHPKEKKVLWNWFFNATSNCPSSSKSCSSFSFHIKICIKESSLPRKLLFWDHCPDQLNCMRWVLLWFEASLRLEVNLKNKLILVGKVPNVEKLVLVLDFGVVQLLVTYLGLPLGVPFRPSIVQEVAKEMFINA